MLGTKMETYQSAGVALPVDCVLVALATDIAKELYLSVLVDRSSKSLTFIASAEGGVEIEKVAEENPEAIKTLHVNFVQGLQPYQCRELGFALGVEAKRESEFAALVRLQALHEVHVQRLDRFWILFGDLFDFHAAFGRGDEGQRLAGAVDQHREVQLLGDVGGQSDQHAIDRQRDARRLVGLH